MKNVLAMLLAGAMVCTLTAGCSGKPSGTASGGGGTTAGGDETYTIKVGLILTTDDPQSIMIQKMADNLKETSDGRIDMQVYYNSELGSNADLLETISRGANTMVWLDPAALSDYAPSYAAMYAPYTYDDPSQIQTIAYSEVGDAFYEEAAAAGLCAVNRMGAYFGTRHCLANKVLATPADFKGVNFRVPSTELWVKTFEALGANPTNIAFSEAYSALSQGVADGIESPFATLYANKFHEAVKELTLTQHFIAPNGLIMSQEYFESMPEDLQTMLTDACMQFNDEETKAQIDSDDTYKQKLIDEGVNIHEADVEALTEACKDVPNKFTWGSTYYPQMLELLGK